ncbi:hypothetical protein NQ176_g11343 [Zarea fungicola]|uniref:Uncharacterized protein n=1 Tax=Zarea fungicola TaxID=93591 RepID=A0ACC1MAS1_9HYPO|nr:hypothetical protein NQ176_g11343 [Lecanicillium fungicola]
MYLDGAAPDFYTDPFDAPPSWFETFPVSKVLIMGGMNEIMMPMIEMFAEKVKSGLPNVELFGGKGESHVAPVYNIYVGDNTETEQGKKLKTWLIELLK